MPGPAKTWPDRLPADPTAWLLASDEPWTRYRTLRDLLDLPESDPAVEAARAELLAHPAVQGLARQAAAWGDQPLKRHNDASHSLYAFSTLADMGLRATDAPKLDGLDTGLEAILAHQAPEGAFQTVVLIPERFGGTGLGAWSWVLCDAPTLLYALLAMGLNADPRVRRAVEHLLGAATATGWPCAASPELGRFRGPGRKDDPCPVANVYALKALALVPEVAGNPAVLGGAEMLLGHWQRQHGRKLYLFGIGTDYRKLKYPFVWYNLLHVAEVLSRFPSARGDPRFREMLQEIALQADERGRFTAGSVYLAWKGWSFAGKKHPSPWLTFLCCRILKRVFGEDLNEYS
jgi:hypothetical protein